MDQVLVNFLGGTKRVLGYEFNHPAVGTDYERWEKIRAVPNFWRNLQWMPEAKSLWNRLVPHGPHILSACPTPHEAPTCYMEKMSWCTEELQIVEHKVHLVFFRGDKKRFATTEGKPNLLIDDHSKNIIEWINAGGIAIHHHNVSETLAELDALGL